MKKRNIILIIVTGAIILAAGVVALIKWNEAAGNTYNSEYNIEDTAAINKIFIADKQDNMVTLTRNSASSWTIDGQYPASQPMVDLLLKTLKDMRKRSDVNRNAVPNVIKDIAAHGIKVEIYQEGGDKYVFYVGRETQDMMASYMLREGEKTPSIVHIPGFRGFLTPRFVSDPIKWRSHRIVDLDVNNIARIELEIPSSPDESFAVVHEGDDFHFELLKSHTRVARFDTVRVAQMLSAFKNLNFDEFASIVPNTFADSCVSGAPRTVLRITDTKGETHVLKTYIKYDNPADMEIMQNQELYDAFDINRLYAILDQKDTVLIQYYVFDNILQPASYFLGAPQSSFAK